MRVTTDHSASSYGVPVILTDGGELMDYASGIKAIRESLGISVEELGNLCGCSKSTVYGWESGRMPEVAALNVMGDLCRKHRRRK